MIRAFIAIALPATVQQSLGTLAKELQATRAAVSWVKPQNIHLTLKFLGDVTPEQISAIEAALTQAVAGTAPLRLQPAGCGAFPTLKQMRVVWVGLQGDLAPLKSLQQAVETALIPLGFEPEKRPFRAHLTLGRVKGRQGARALQDALLARQSFTAEAFDVAEVVLYRSELRPEGAKYTRIFEKQLKEAVE